MSEWRGKGLMAGSAFMAFLIWVFLFGPQAMVWIADRWYEVLDSW